MRNKIHSGKASEEYLYPFRDTPLGTLYLAFSPRGLAALNYEGEETPAPTSPPPVHLAAWVSRAQKALAAYFHGDCGDFSSLPLDLQGTRFQLRVWEELRRIPWGSTISYKELALRAGSPLGFRAVGRANGANPIPIIIPCHRVINAGGSLGGYSSGVERKLWLLRHEGAR